MKVLFLEFLSNFWFLMTSIAPYILVGVVVAGVFKHILPDALIQKHLGENSFIASIKAAVLGIPLPLCSCSVLPFISSLKKSGASKSAIQTFLIATPITGVDSVLATYGVFGWIFSGYRLISSVIISLTAGLLTAIFIADNNGTLEITRKKKTRTKLGDIAISVNPKPTNNLHWKKPVQILSLAFDDIYRDIAKSLMIGVILGALIVSFIPNDLTQYISENQWLNYSLVILVSIPLYMCATASIPLGLSLIIAGFSPGAAFIFLTAGPATNAITISVVLKTLGTSSLLIYLSSVIIGSFLFAYLFDTYFSHGLTTAISTHIEAEQFGFINQVSAVILMYISIKLIFSKNSFLIKTHGGCGGCSKSDC